MSGFVAVIAHEASAPDMDRDVAGLADQYERVRGGMQRESFASGQRVRAVLLTPAWASPAIERDAEAWTFAVGSPQSAGPLAGAPLAELDGQFALLRCNRDELTVATDPFASFGVFHSAGRDRTYVSTSLL